MNYMLRRWDDFARFLDDGRICLSNNAARLVTRVSVPARNPVLGESIADISAVSRICRWLGGRFGSWSLQTDFDAMLPFALDVFSPSASIIAFWCRGHGERRGSILSFTTSAFLWADGQRRVLLAG